jgi:hypothetical protein
MQFVAIDPHHSKIEIIQANELTDVYARVGLKIGEVDFGTLHRYPDGSTLNIVVYEYGLFKPPAEGKYFSIGSCLFEGGAVLFRADAIGDTVSLGAPPPVMFFRGAHDIEGAIARGEIKRPQILVNDKSKWSWPSKP